jgi:WD40 repeat protein
MKVKERFFHYVRKTNIMNKLKRVITLFPIKDDFLSSKGERESRSMGIKNLRRSTDWPVLLLFPILFAFLFNGRLHSSELPKEPILRMETGMHTAPIFGIAIDVQNKFLVTGSDDKTVRVWELFTGKLLKILRPPIGEGHGGMIHAVAISPDGKTIACGGNTDLTLEKSQSIYLVDFESGKLFHRIKDLPSPIFYLAYSKDGRFLVATMLRKGGGIRVFDTSNYSMVAEDKDYGDSVTKADFDGTGKLATSCFDGFVRLYGNDFKLIIKKKAPGGKKPLSAIFSPDGSSIAVSFADSLTLDVLSGKDLAHQYSPDTRGIASGSFFQTCWSSDGKFLYAGKRIGPPFIIRKWSNGGRRGWRWGYKDLTVEENGITQILPLKDGGIVFSTFGPAFGVIAADDKKIVAVSPPIADYRWSQSRFLVSHDGSTIQPFYEKFGKSPFRFSTIERSLEINPSSQEDLLPPNLQAFEPKLTDWEGTLIPKLNGRPLKLHPDEFSLSLAIAPKKDTFLLGTVQFLHLFDKEGSQKWEVASPGWVWAVNATADGRFAVAALGDGTIRWYRMKDGKELLAFFPHIDKKRWVLWTPSGYYDASPGAEELIGWHVNNGREEASDFFPVSRFRGTYYRPDIVAKTLETLDEAEAIKLANKESGKKTEEVPVAKIFPPVISILSPNDGSEVSTTEVEVKFAIRTPSSEPVTRVRVLVDGRPIEKGLAINPTQKDQDIQSTKVTIPEKDTEISIIAENKYAVSEPATVSLKWSGKVKEEVFIIKPKLYVLAIGVSKYEDKNLILQFAAKDAKDFADSFLNQKGGLYRDVTVKVLTDEKATKDEIIDGFDWISKETTNKDIALVFLAGHGVNEKGGVYYFLPVNANIDKLRRTGVPFTEMKNTVASLAGKTILFIDTCHAGNVLGARGAPTDIMGVVNELASAENGAVVFASSTGKQYSFEDLNWGNGAFTKAVVEGINGKADYLGKGRITINMLDLYVSERVKELTKGKQTPATAKPQTIPDFPLVLKR